MSTMAESLWKQAEEQFHLALELPVEERASHLAGLETELRQEVTTLIEAYEASEAMTCGPEPAKPATQPRRIGPYTVVKQVGEGGMGAVFQAERTDAQFEKRVAIKLIRPGPGSPPCQ